MSETEDDALDAEDRGSNNEKDSLAELPEPPPELSIVGAMYDRRNKVNVLITMLVHIFYVQNINQSNMILQYVCPHS